jgi:cell division septation protein DedD
VNTRYLEDEDLDAPRDREISLGATTLLGIFLLLALVCAVFFGFGYSMGRRSAVSAAPTTDPEETTTLKTTGAAKPAPGLTPAPKPSTETVDKATADSDDSASTAPQLPQPTQAPTAATAQPSQQKPQPTPTAGAKPAAYSPAPQFTPPTVSKAAPAPAAPHSATTVAPAGPPALVQIAAVSHQEDADTLVNALKRRGYEVTVRHEPQDKLLHIQVGPYANRKDADAMRQRLLADGYNAIVK